MLGQVNITIYNQYIDPATRSEKYQRTVIPHVHWENRKAINRSKIGDISADSVMVFIPFAVGDDYLKPVAWQALPVKTGKWTLQTGDILVKGAVTDELSSSFTASDLKEKYDDVVAITSVDTMDYGTVGLQHWEVSGK